MAKTPKTKEAGVPMPAYEIEKPGAWGRELFAIFYKGIGVLDVYTLSAERPDWVTWNHKTNDWVWRMKLGPEILTSYAVHFEKKLGAKVTEITADEAEVLRNKIQAELDKQPSPPLPKPIRIAGELVQKPGPAADGEEPSEDPEGTEDPDAETEPTEPAADVPPHEKPTGEIPATEPEKSDGPLKDTAPHETPPQTAEKSGKRGKHKRR